MLKGKLVNLKGTVKKTHLKIFRSKCKESAPLGKWFRVKMAAIMMGKMIMRMALRMNGWHGRMMTMKMEMLGKVEVVVSKDLVGKVEVEVVSKVEVEVLSRLVMALMGEMLVAMAMEEAMVMVEAMVWVGGRAMTTMAMMVGVIVEVVVEVVAAVEVPSASSNR